MVSRAMQSYLAEIYRLGQGQGWISTTALAAQMAVSKPAVVAMVRRLAKAELVEYQPYQGVRLREAGRKVALLYIRRQRLLERLLVDLLGLGWDEVLAEAQKLHQGEISPRLEERLEAVLRYPGRCPHGEPIPDPEGDMPRLEDRPLTTLLPGAKGRISRVRTRDPARLRYLGQIGLRPGTAFELVSLAPFEGPLVLAGADREWTLGREIAGVLWVERTG